MLFHPESQKQMIVGGRSIRFPFSPPSPYRCRRNCFHRRQLPQSLIEVRCGARPAFSDDTRRSGSVVLMKQGHQFLSSLAVSRDSSAAKRQIRKFVASSQKSVALNVLSHLLSPCISDPRLSSFALDLYLEISEASWFDWNPKLVAHLIALLNKQERYVESESLFSLGVSKLKSSERDLALFYCNLIESNSKHRSAKGFNESYARLREIICITSSVYVKRQAYKSVVGGLCEMDRPHDAENVIEEMRRKEIKPALFEYRFVIYGYGRLGCFEDMKRAVQKMETVGLRIDTVCSNMVLSSYGNHDVLPEMGLWLQKMRHSDIPFSARTYNSVLNSCPIIISVLKDLDGCPLSFSELIKILNEDEAKVVAELVQSSVLNKAMVWNTSEAKLDLHGMHLSSAYLIMMQWMDEIRLRLSDAKCVIPAEVVVVCGSGKHSNIRGESPVKALVKKLMVRTKSPMRIDRKNIGRFFAKGKVVKEWLECDSKLSRHKSSPLFRISID